MSLNTVVDLLDAVVDPAPAQRRSGRHRWRLTYRRGAATVQDCAVLLKGDIAWSFRKSPVAVGVVVVLLVVAATAFAAPARPPPAEPTT